MDVELQYCYHEQLRLNYDWMLQMHMYNLTVAAVTIKALCACVSLILTHGIACVYIEAPKRFDGSITAIYTIIIIIMNDYFLLVNTIYI